jgi:putative oxidoreductase
MEKWGVWAPRMLAVLRIMAALLFMEHGLMKLFHFPAAQPGAPDPLPMMLMIAALIEVVGGALLVLGLFTRPVAFICAGEMAVAYFIAHGSQSFWPALNGGDAAILFCFVFLYLAAAGGGAWSVDGMRGKPVANEP